MRQSICVFAVFIMLLSIICCSGCGFGTWTNTGGKVSNFGADALVYDSAHNVLYAGCEQQIGDCGVTAGRGVWKYDGMSWTDTGGSVSSYYINSLAYDSAHNLLYASCYKMSPGAISAFEPHGTGVWKYNGKTWINIGRPKISSLVDALAYDSAHNVLYAGCEYSPSAAGVWKYDGKSWTDTGGDKSILCITSFAYDGKHNLLYAGTRSNGVLKYTGTEWSNTGGGVSGFWVDGLAYDSAHNLLYAGTGAGVEDINHFGHSVWKYDGANWTDTGGIVPRYSVDHLACDSAHNRIYACYYSHSDFGINGISKYDGTTWTKISDEEMSNYNFRSIVYDPTSNLLYVGCSDASINGINGKGVWKYKGR